MNSLRIQIPQRGDNLREGPQVEKITRRFAELRQTEEYKNLQTQLRVQLEMACYMAKDVNDFEARASKVIGHQI